MEYQVVCLSSSDTEDIDHIFCRSVVDSDHSSLVDGCTGVYVGGGLHHLCVRCGREEVKSRASALRDLLGFVHQNQIVRKGTCDTVSHIFHIPEIAQVC